MNKYLFSALTASVIGLTGCMNDDDKSSVQPADESVTSLSSKQLETSLSNSWFQQGQQEIVAAKETWATVTGSGDAVAQSESVQEAIADARGKAKNVILFVGDGMGVSTVTAARILEGQNLGKLGEEHQLSFERFPFAGLAKTYNVDAQVPDSAGTMTAMVSGVKTNVGVVGVDEDVIRGDCSSAAGNELITTLELAEISGKATGVVTTARITHATPAATYAKSAERNWEDISDMPAEAVQAGCKDIADQLVRFEQLLEQRYAGVDIDGIDVVMGGGRRHFLPRDSTFNSPDAMSSVEGDRTDSRNLIAEWQAQYPQGVYVYDKAGFDSVNPATTSRLFGLFNESHMQYEADRGNDVAGEPSLSEMTAKAIDILDNDTDGFFLTVEAGRIDHASHAGSAYGALTETIELAKAVQVAVDQTSAEDTLIIVTGDHSHGLTMAGYPRRGNPILGKVVGIEEDQPALAADDLPYTTPGYAHGLGTRDYGSETDADRTYGDPVNAGRMDLTNVDTTTPGYHQEALVPLGSETHAGEAVGIYARGPGANLLTGTNEQNMIYHVMDYAADISGAANQEVQ